MSVLHTTVDSPIGRLLLSGDGERLSGLHMQDGPRPRRVGEGWRCADEAFTAARAQLAEYFVGQRREFDLELDPSGSDFQLRVWAALRQIPYGQTESYGELAARVGAESARAVGSANGQNPISVIVPCHRVIGSDGSLTGYGGGLQRKRVLLELESGVGALAV